MLPVDLARRARNARTWQLATLSVALVWSIGLLVAAVTLPAYQGVTVSATGASSTSTATLVEVNGRGVLALVAIPLAAVVLVAGSSAFRGWRRRDGAGPFAWTVVGLLGAFAFLAMMTIGIFILPVVALLAIACATAPRDRPCHPPPREPAVTR